MSGPPRSWLLSPGCLPLWPARSHPRASKGFAKYPGGVHNRWELIAEMIGTGRTARDVIAKAEQLKATQVHGARLLAARRLPDTGCHRFRERNWMIHSIDS